MLRCGNCQFKWFSMTAEIDELLMVAIENVLFHFLSGFQSPVKTKFISIQFISRYHSQVVNHVSTADNQHPFFAERTKFLCQFIVELRHLVIIQTHMNYRHIGIWISWSKWHCCHEFQKIFPFHEFINSPELPSVISPHPASWP